MTAGILRPSLLSPLTATSLDRPLSPNRCSSHKLPYPSPPPQWSCFPETKIRYHHPSLTVLWGLPAASKTRPQFHAAPQSPYNSQLLTTACTPLPEASLPTSFHNAGQHTYTLSEVAIFLCAPPRLTVLGRHWCLYIPVSHQIAKLSTTGAQ